MKRQKRNSATRKQKKHDLPGIPVYGPAEDIYTNSLRAPFMHDATASLNRRLDMPDAELHGADEKIAEEDKEPSH